MKLLAKKLKFPLGIQNELINCFNQVPASVRAKYSGAMCIDLINKIQTAQVKGSILKLARNVN